MTLKPVEIAKGYLRAAPEDARQYITIWQVANDAIELRFDASGIKRVLQVDQIAGHEVRLAIEKAIGVNVTIDYAASALTFSGLRPPSRPASLFPRTR